MPRLRTTCILPKLIHANISGVVGASGLAEGQRVGSGDTASGVRWECNPFIRRAFFGCEKLTPSHLKKLTLTGTLSMHHTYKDGVQLLVTQIVCIGRNSFCAKLNFDFVSLDADRNSLHRLAAAIGDKK